MLFMLSLIKAVARGTINGFAWYGRRIQESKWYIIPIVIDVILIPVKFVIIPCMCLTKQGRKAIISLGQSIMEDE